MTGSMPNVFTIPADTNFSATLVSAILAGDLPHCGGSAPDRLELAEWTILVPTRRAVRTIVTTFGDQTRHGASLLPRIHPLGDADEDDIQSHAILSGKTELDIPPAISALKRQFVLCGLVRDWFSDRRDSDLAGSMLSSTSLALSLSESLGRLIDRFDTDDVPMDAVRELFDGELPIHREDFLKVLDIVRKRYPAYLEAHGLIGQMARRSRLIRTQAAHLAVDPAAAPVIAAGSTGSIPATAELLKTIAGLPTGAVVLPGLDRELDEESWAALAQDHPQYGLRELLQHIGVDRADVQELGSPAEHTDRGWFMSEVMRPSATSEKWREVVSLEAKRLETACAGLNWVQAPDQQSEALSVALILRRALERPGVTAALVTPDRQLARRVRTELGRWGVSVDDTAGIPVSRTPPGAFLFLLADAALNGFKPSRIIALLDHPFALFGITRNELARAANHLEAAVFRGRLSAQELSGLARDVERSRSAINAYSHHIARHLTDADWQGVTRLAEQLTAMLEGVARLFASAEPRPLADFIQAHLRTAEVISSNAETDGMPLWQGEAGSVLSDLFSALQADADECPPLLPADYVALVHRLMAAAPVRPAHAGHPRLAIYGLLEARLIGADVTVLAGLNEGVWPAEAEIDPWLNRPQKVKLGLQSPERRLGLMAHDFAQAAAVGEVWMTSSRKIDGQPAVASRWLLRMKALLNAAGKEALLNAEEPWAGWALGLDSPATKVRIKPPRPKPPVAARPSRLSVTRIDRLIRDPYGVFARHVLGLEPLDAAETRLGTREKGTLVHTALERFVRNNPHVLGKDASEKLMDEFQGLFDEMISDPALYAFWKPQMQRIADWFVEQERQWRTDAVSQHVEQTAALTFNVAGAPFTLSCVADRIDVKRDGTVRLIDYKTGVLPGLQPASDAYSVQLDLEAHMVTSGAFECVGQVQVSELIYVRLSGGDPPGVIKPLAGNIADRAQGAFAGLLSLLQSYADPDQPYVAIGGPSREERAFDFDHLSRWREWHHLDGEGPAP